MADAAIRQPLRMQIIWEVLEAAKDNCDETVIAACRRLINADTIGWRKHHDPKDFALVMAFVVE
jgi:hypothetical protein